MMTRRIRRAACPWATVVATAFAGAAQAAPQSFCDINLDGIVDGADLGMLLGIPPHYYQFEITGAPNAVQWQWQIDVECNGPPHLPLSSGLCISIGPPMTALQVANDFAACINAPFISLVCNAFTATAGGKVFLVIRVYTPLPWDDLDLCISSTSGPPLVGCCPVPFATPCVFNPSIREVPPAELCNWECRADLDWNGVVNGGDLGTLLGVWGSTDPCADLDGNGHIDGGDLGTLLGAWGPCGS